MRGAFSRGLMLSILLVTIQAQASDRFEQSVEVDGSRLERCGTGELVAYHIFTVGHAALYRPKCDISWAMPANESATILFRYTRDIPAHAFPEAAEKMLARNIDDPQLRAQMPSRLKAFHSAYRAVEDGDLYQISYQREAGLSLFLNQKPLAVLADGPLARLYFSIWLGDAPFDEVLKDDLLGR